MGKAVRIDEDSRLAEALASGVEYLIVGQRQFRIVEVTGWFYEPTDPDEVMAVEEALHEDSQVLGSEEGRTYLTEELRKYGIG